MKDKIIDQLQERVSDGDLYQWNEDTNLGNNLVQAAEEVEPEYFKCIDWLITQFAGQTQSVRDLYDAANFINRELGPVLLALRAKNKPWPQLRDKKFTPDVASQFVEENMAFVPSGDVVGPYDEWDDTVYKFDNGWRIAMLDPENVEREGEEMNNCLKDNDSYHWTDKAEQHFIVVFSLRDPLNRPHVSASARYDDWQRGSLVYTEGPLLKNNRALGEDPEYNKMWEQFEGWVQERGGTITRGSDDWEEEEEEEAEPYHDEDRDTEEYGENLEVDSLWELQSMWNEALGGCADWGRDYDRSETHYDSDWDGNPYYYYETYGGRRVNSTDSGLETAVEEWADEVKQLEWNGTDGTSFLDMEPRDFVGAVVLWATVLEDSEGYDGYKVLQDCATLLNNLASEYDDPDVKEQSRQLLRWAARELVSERSFAAVKGVFVPYSGEDQRRVEATEFAPVNDFEPVLGEPIEGWGQVGQPKGQQPPQPQDAGVWTGPRAPVPQQPQQQQLPGGGPTFTPEELNNLKNSIREIWERNPVPETLNYMGDQLVTLHRLRPEDAVEILQEVTGEQVGFREAKVSADEGWYEDWGGPAPEPSNYMYGDFGPAGEGARFGPGDYVKMMHGSQGGVIVGEPVHSFEGLAYYVDTYDSEGPRGIELWNESLLHRPDGYDKPGESTLEDWFGITPEGEDYYRTAKR
jgi:hypothetical protein